MEINNEAVTTMKKNKKIKMKKRSEETQTLRAGCSKAEPKNFAPPQTPFTVGGDGTAKS